MAQYSCKSLKTLHFQIAFISKQDPSKLAHSLGAVLACSWCTLRIHWVHFTHSLGRLYAFTGYIINIYWVHYHWWATCLLCSQRRVYCYTLRSYWYLGYTHIFQNISLIKKQTITKFLWFEAIDFLLLLHGNIFKRNVAYSDEKEKTLSKYCNF